MTLPHFTALGSGPLVLMLHGLGGGHRAFAPQVETLASQGYRAVAWDMPGYGSSPPVEPYTFKALAARCIALIEALRPGARSGSGVTLLGHSMGGMVAQEVALRRPDLVERLVLCATSAAFGRRADGSQHAAWVQAFIAKRTAPLDAGLDMADLAHDLVAAAAGPAALPEGLALARLCTAQVHAATYRKALEALVTFDRQADLPRLAQPSLLVAGEHDRQATPASMSAMTDAMPQARLVTLKGVGHWVHLEDPDGFDAALLGFLQDNAPRRVLH